MSEGVSSFITSPDGLKLHVRCYGPHNSSLPPVVCLPGLARTADDFTPLAHKLSAGEKAHRVIAVDYRGRGLSDYDPNPANYTVSIELADLLTVLTALKAMPAIIIGTSRGGILAMLLGAAKPGAVAAVVLNDIGPVIESEGLMRIKGYVGKLPQPQSYEDAATILRRLFIAQFPRLTDAEWLASAHRTFKVKGGVLIPTYDPNLSLTLVGVAPDKPLPDLWEQFDTLAAVPLMVIRGLLSDLLSSKTVVAMRARRSSIEIVEVPDQGHAPLLTDEPTMTSIERFVNAVSQGAP